MMSEPLARLVSGMEPYELFPDGETVYIDPYEVQAVVPRTITVLVDDDDTHEEIDPVDVLTLIISGQQKPIVVRAPRAS